MAGIGSRYSGFKDQREPAETGQRGCFFCSWAFAARAMCFAKEEFLVRQKKRRSSATQGTSVSCLSPLTRSLSRHKVRGVAPSPFLPLLTTIDSELAGRAISAKETRPMHGSPRDPHGHLPLTKHKPSSPRVSARHSATRASPIAYLMSIQFCIVYIQDCWLVVGP